MSLLFRPTRCRNSLFIPNTISQRCRVSTKEIRKSFIKYFEDYDHIHVPSCSVLAEEEDKSLLFTNAGMNQFKPVFMGSTSHRWSCLHRAVNYQKCLRVGGKHNDLEDVGQDFHHQTFFEMLGNWSFNNGYTKEAACHLAWNFLVHVMKISPERLYVSYFGGEGTVPADTASKEIWMDIGVPESRIIPFVKENFWEMGTVGPCGPCTEIHYDMVEGRQNAEALVNKDNSIVELWNIVFMSLNRNADGSLSPLPNHHIDTGMGLERLASVVQKVGSNFDTDVFSGLMKTIAQSSPIQYSGNVGGPGGSRSDAAYRILADHMRAVTIALSDGVQFGPDGAGFVIRKMLRRACWQAVNNLKIDRGFTAELVPVVVESLDGAYPGLSNSMEFIQRSVKEEEEQYWRILDKGRKLFDSMLVKTPPGSDFSGKAAWTLHDTHGFPIDVTEYLLRNEGRKVDMEEFNKLKEEAKKLSKKASSFSSSPLQVNSEDFPTHSDSAKYNYELKGDSYVFPRLSTEVLGVFSEASSSRVERLSGKCSLVLRDCQFYAEEGGQKTDKGQLFRDGKPVFEVLSAEKIGGVTVLHGNTLNGEEICEDDVVEQRLDETRRCGLMRAHSATHLLNWALRKIGAGLGQRGSSVDVDYLRFDYAAGDTAGEDEVVEEVESLISSVISDQSPVSIEEIPLEKAREMKQLQSEFRESKQYPSMVRVACVGSSLDENAIAVECCSGTHVLNTSSISDFCVLSDRSSAKSVRRIVALTGARATGAKQYAKGILSKLEKLDQSAIDAAQLSAFRKTIEWSRVPYVDGQRINEILRELKKKSKQQLKLKS